LGRRRFTKLETDFAEPESQAPLVREVGTTLGTENGPLLRVREEC